MSGLPSINRRNMLRLMGSALAALPLSLTLPIKSRAKPPGDLPGSLSLLPLHPGLFRQARRCLEAHPGRRRLYQVTQNFVHAMDNPHALARFRHIVRQDFLAGRVTVLDGWVVADTEMALLALL